MYPDLMLTIEEIPEFNDLFKKASLINNNINYNIGCIEPGFYYTDEELHKITEKGGIGWVGSGIKKICAGAHCLELMIDTSKEIIDKLVSEHNLQTKRKGRSTMSNTGGMFCSVNRQETILETKTKIIPKKIIKGKYYDIVLNAIRKTKPKYTEKELIDERQVDGYTIFNTNVVDDIIEEHTKTEYVYGKPKFFLRIGVVTKNIENNVDKILDIIRSYTKLQNIDDNSNVNIQ